VFRLSKITDYGIVLLAHLARDGAGDAGGEVDSPHNAREVAAEVDLPLPVVSKILKSLARRGILESHRGSKGGYSLVRRPEEITVSEMIAALEGPVALTECSLAPQICQHEGSCAIRDPWQVINRAVQGALDQVTLADLIDPTFPRSPTPVGVVDVSLGTPAHGASTPAHRASTPAHGASTPAHGASTPAHRASTE